MSPELIVIVPTRSRPHNVAPVVQAWLDTGAFSSAELAFVVDHDDPSFREYCVELHAASQLLAPLGYSLRYNSRPRHQQLVPKLNHVARLHATLAQHYAVGFAGDDHLPRTADWPSMLLDVLHEMGTGIAYPDDGYQHETIPTSWVMTSDIVRVIDGLVPARRVEHLFCDNSVRDLGVAAGCLRYVPDVLVEHMHPVVGKAPRDAQYERVNSRAQWRADKQAYQEWQRHDLPRQAERVRALKGE